MFPVYEFRHLGLHFRIVQTVHYPWKRRIGFKPKQPYLLIRDDDSAINGVTEADLEWYRKERPNV